MKVHILWHGPQYLTLAADGACEALYSESYGLQQATDGALGAVSGEHASGTHGPMDACKNLGRPHLGLFFGSEGVEVDDVDIVRQRSGEEVAAALLQREVGRDGRGLLPRRSMDGGKEGRIDKRLVAQALYQSRLHGVFLQGDVVHRALSRGGHGSDGSIEARAEAYLEQAQGTMRRVLGGMQIGTVAVDMERLGVSSLHGVVVFVELGHEERGRAIVGMLYLEVGHSVDCL